MCDYSLHAVESRPAQIADKLISTSFRHSSTSGFAAQDDLQVAVCLLPGTELAFDEDVKFYQRWIWTKSTGFRVARFCSVDGHAPDRHHDALEFPDGRKVLVTLLTGGQRATVLQLPVRRETADRLRAAEHQQELASHRTAAVIVGNSIRLVSAVEWPGDPQGVRELRQSLSPDGSVGEGEHTARLGQDVTRRGS